MLKKSVIRKWDNPEKKSKKNYLNDQQHTQELEAPEFPRSNPLPASLGKTDQRSLQEFSNWYQAESESIDREIERQDREFDAMYREGIIDWTPLQ